MSKASIKFFDDELPEDPTSVERRDLPEDHGHRGRRDEGGSSTVPMPSMRGFSSDEVSTATPSADEFLRLAAAFEALQPDQCRGDVYRTRCHVAAQLRAAKEKPEHAANVAILRAAQILLPSS